MTPSASLRAPWQDLLRFQLDTPTDGLPRETEAELTQALAAFANWCQAPARGRAWSPAEQAAWAQVARALVASAASQPPVALQPGGRAGPLLHDVARLLRGPGGPADESEELDALIRWWEAARGAGLPVDADFGECWRALEWTALLQHLLRLADSDVGEDEESALRAAVSRVALRYGPLKPLLRLLPAQPGADVGAGYTF